MTPRIISSFSFFKFLLIAGSFLLSLDVSSQLTTYAIPPASNSKKPTSDQYLGTFDPSLVYFGVSAAAEAMGQTGVADRTDAAAGWYNPANYVGVNSKGQSVELQGGLIGFNRKNYQKPSEMVAAGVTSKLAIGFSHVAFPTRFASYNYAVSRFGLACAVSDKLRIGADMSFQNFKNYDTDEIQYLPLFNLGIASTLISTEKMKLDVGLAGFNLLNASRKVKLSDTEFTYYAPMMVNGGASLTLMPEGTSEEALLTHVRLNVEYRHCLNSYYYSSYHQGLEILLSNVFFIRQGFYYRSLWDLGYTIYPDHYSSFTYGLGAKKNFGSNDKWLVTLDATYLPAGNEVKSYDYSKYFVNLGLRYTFKAN